VVRLDGLDSCVIGVCCRCGQEDVLLYDGHKVVELLMDRDGMTWEEAEEFYCLNISGAWMGSGTPCFMEPYIDGVDGIPSSDVVEIVHNRREGD